MFLFLLFQGTFRIFNDPVSRENTMSTMQLRPSKPIDCVVRVYVIRVSKRLLFLCLLIYFCSLINMITLYYIYMDISAV